VTNFPFLWTIGDVVLIRCNRKWARATIIDMDAEYPVDAVRGDITVPRIIRIHSVLLQRHGLDINNKRFVRLRRKLTDLRRPPEFDGLSAHVYADWLEDHGEVEAAGKLREGFPTKEQEIGKKETQS
jgi:hypothetical protein